MYIVQLSNDTSTCRSATMFECNMRVCPGLKNTVSNSGSAHMYTQANTHKPSSRLITKYLAKCLSKPKTAPNISGDVERKQINLIIYWSKRYFVKFKRNGVFFFAYYMCTNKYRPKKCRCFRVLFSSLVYAVRLFCCYVCWLYFCWISNNAKVLTIHLKKNPTNRACHYMQANDKACQEHLL